MTTPISIVVPGRIIYPADQSCIIWVNLPPLKGVTNSDNMNYFRITEIASVDVMTDWGP